MKKLFLLIYLVAMSCIAIAHDAHYDKLVLRQWHFTSGQKTIVGSFYMFKDNKVFIEDINGEILSIPLSRPYCL